MPSDSNTSFEFQIASTAKEAEKGIENITKDVKDLKGVLESLNNVIGGTQKSVQKGLEKASQVTTLKERFQKLGESLTKPFEKARKSVSTLFASIGRIAFYRAIRSGIKAVTHGFSEGIEHLYAWSEAFNTKFAPAMDMYKTQMAYLHNGFASMFSPLIEWVIPNVIVPLTDALVELFNFIQQGFATLVGHDYWYKAQKSMTKFGESTKKANYQLEKFDELNNLTDSGSGSSEDTSGMFTLERVSTEVSDVIGTIKDKVGGIVDNVKQIGDVLRPHLDWILDYFFPKVWEESEGFRKWFSENFVPAIGEFGVSFADDLAYTFEHLFDGGWGVLRELWNTIVSIADLIGSMFDNELDPTKALKDLAKSLTKLILNLIRTVVMLVGNLFAMVMDGVQAVARFFGKETAIGDDYREGLNSLNEQFNVWEDQINDWWSVNKETQSKITEDQKENFRRRSWTMKEFTATVTDENGKIANTFRDNGLKIVQSTDGTLAKVTANYESSTWTIRNAVKNSGIPEEYQGVAKKALADYMNSVDWQNGGELSAQKIAYAFMSVGIEENVAKEAANSCARFIAAQWGQSGQEGASKQTLGFMRGLEKGQPGITDKVNKLTGNANLFNPGVEQGSKFGYGVEKGANSTGRSYFSQKFSKVTEYANTQSAGEKKGEEFTGGMADGINGNKGEVTTAIPQMFGGVDVTPEGQKIGQQVVDGAVSAITSGNGGSPITAIIDSLTNPNKAALTGVGSIWGSYIVDGIKTFIKGNPIVVEGKAQSVTSTNGRVTYSMNARGGYLFESGGFASGLTQGTMYVAGEVPGQAEMVGNINGRTGVASGYEITGIRDAVLSTGEAEVMLLQRLITALEKKNLVISPSAQLGRVVAQSNRMYAGVTG